jgi:hypothetical protein
VIIRALPLVLAAVVVLAACPGAQKIADKLPDGPPKPVIHGKFANEGCLASPNADGTTSYLTLTFDVTPSSWAGDVVMYGEETCTTKQGTIHMEGALIRNLRVGAGRVRDGRHIRQAHITARRRLHRAHAVAVITQSTYAVRRRTSAPAAGHGLPPITECPRDHGLVKLEGDGSLRFGKRPADNDVCSPTSAEAQRRRPETRHCPGSLIVTDTTVERAHRGQRRAHRRLVSSIITSSTMRRSPVVSFVRHSARERAAWRTGGRGPSVLCASVADTDAGFQRHPRRLRQVGRRAVLIAPGDEPAVGHRPLEHVPVLIGPRSWWRARARRQVAAASLSTLSVSTTTTRAPPGRGSCPRDLRRCPTARGRTEPRHDI